MNPSPETIGHGSYDKLNEAGYLILPVLEPDLAKNLARTICLRALDLIFVKPGYPVDPDDPESLLLFIDPKLRDTIGARTATWRNGNSRQPLINRTTGMIEIHFEPDILEHVLFNDRVLEASAATMDVPKDKLIYALGPERVSIKVKGTPAMKKHCDYNFFKEAAEFNYPYRIQSLVTLDIDTRIKPEASGTLCILSHFHHFMPLVSYIFNPKYGIPNCRFPEAALKTRFLDMPSYFESRYLKTFKHCAQLYLESLQVAADRRREFVSKFVGTDEDTEAFSRLFDIWHCNEIFHDRDPELLLNYLHKVEWTPISAKPGDMIFWHQHLPHRSCANKSKITRVVSYVNLYPAGDDWNDSYQQTWVAEQFTTAKSRYATNSNNIESSKHTNPEEYQDLVDRGMVDHIVKLSQASDTRRRLTGQLPI